MSPALAATTPASVGVIKAAYLITAPHLEASRIVVEPLSTSLQIVSRSTQSWWHVEGHKSRTGYITRNFNWTTPVSDLVIMDQGGHVAFTLAMGNDSGGRRS